MAKHRLVIVGSGGHAKVCVDIARKSGEYDIIGLLDDDLEQAGIDVLGLKVLGGRELFDELLQDGVTHGFCGIGHNVFRLDICEHLEDAGFVLPVLKHPLAAVGECVYIDAGTVIVAGAVINPDSRIGKAGLINTSCTVDHDNTLGDAVHISPGAHLGGGVTVGDRTQVGIGASVLPNVTIGKDVIIGGGAAVVRDVPNGTKFVGVPARPL